MKKIVLLILSSIMIFSCDGSSSSVSDLVSDPTIQPNPLLQQSSGKDITALVVTNTSGNASGSSESVGNLPFSSRLQTRAKIDSPTVYYRDLPGLNTNSFPLLQSKTRSTLLGTTRKISSASTNYTFNALDGSNGDNDISVLATLVYGTSSTKCLIYLADGYSTTNDDWSTIGKYFDNTIYNKMVTGFGAPTDVDGNGQVVIFYYNYGISNVLGFFYARDLYGSEYVAYSNEMEIFYMNYPCEPVPGDGPDPGHSEMMRTLAHEFQHMINAGSRIYAGLGPMDTWIDEGLAESAEHYAIGTPGQSRIDTFNADSKNIISNGLALCAWEETENYVLSYTFMQYLRIHSASGTGIYKKLIASTDGSYSGLTDIASVENKYFYNFETIIKSYRIANMLQQDTGIFGYGSENSTFDLTVQKPTTNISNIKLKPGGSIAIIDEWSAIQAASGSGKGPNIDLSSVQRGVVIDL